MADLAGDLCTVVELVCAVSGHSDIVKRARFSGACSLSLGCVRLRSSCSVVPKTLCKRDSFSSTADFSAATFVSRVLTELISFSQLQHK